MMYPTINQFLLNGILSQVEREDRVRVLLAVFQTKYDDERIKLERQLTKVHTFHNERMNRLITSTGVETPAYQSWLIEIAQTEYGFNLSKRNTTL